MRHRTVIGDSTVFGYVANVFDPLVNLRTGLRLWWASW